ncbi:hypothetical protein RCL1_001880 [Eukaryota sp. TZLM3-RCL]
MSFDYLHQNLDSLSPKERDSFIRYCDSLDSDISQVALKVINSQDFANDSISPLENVLTSKVASLSQEERTALFNSGMSFIAANKAAVVILAGGQGTRLGFDHPKGMFDINLPSKKSIFQIHSEKILRLCKLSGGSVPLCIMTSPINDNETRTFFIKNNYFGLDSDSVYFFIQGSLPAFYPDGSLILEKPGLVAQSPDGNGGVFKALQTSGVLDKLKTRGVEGLFLMSVDNVLARPADPTFIGFCTDNSLECANLCTERVNPMEAVGVMGVRNNLPSVIEYSELTEDQRFSVLDGKSLLFNAANIAMHWFSCDLISKIVAKSHLLPYHKAHKKIPYWDASSSSTVSPTCPNGYKLEMFVFDAFAAIDSMSQFGCMIVDRKEIFAPVKNAKGVDSPDSAREMILELHKKWLLPNLNEEVSSNDELVVEISPLVSYCGEGLDNVNVPNGGVHILEVVDGKVLFVSQ